MEMNQEWLRQSLVDVFNFEPNLQSPGVVKRLKGDVIPVGK